MQHCSTLPTDLIMRQILSRPLLIAVLALGCANTIPAEAQSRSRHGNHFKPAKTRKVNATPAALPEGEIIGKRILFADGSSIQGDEVWKQGDEYWYRVGNLSQRVERLVHSIEPIRAQTNASVQSGAPEKQAGATMAFWIYLKGGARVKAEEVSETFDGAWYRRENLSVFLERERIARIERESPASRRAGWTERDWTSGNSRIDDLIRLNATRFSIDPYLVFCVIEHESHFRVQAVSPKGARGLMQLMPGTASRFGVRRVFDPAENIYGGTQYLKELFRMFDGRLELALASYNAGEGAVIKYGGKVPPYRETRDYVKRITQRYGADNPESAEKNLPSPR
jgi:soluble lytic murein transglycosylase-like protein